MKKNLLVIDDETGITDNLKLVFRKHTDQVFTANSGQDGLDILADEEIHCVICDIRMPGMNGLEVIRKVRDSGNNVPFIFFTAYVLDELKVKVSEYEATIFLEKLDTKKLVEMVSVFLNQSTRLSQVV
ncbi:MAG: response regulator [Bdellovibrionota bacterium]